MVKSQLKVKNRKTQKQRIGILWLKKMVLIKQYEKIESNML